MGQIYSSSINFRTRHFTDKASIGGFAREGLREDRLLKVGTSEEAGVDVESGIVFVGE